MVFTAHDEFNPTSTVRLSNSIARQRSKQIATSYGVATTIIIIILDLQKRRLFLDLITVSAPIFSTVSPQSK